MVASDDPYSGNSTTGDILQLVGSFLGGGSGRPLGSGLMGLGRYLDKSSYNDYEMANRPKELSTFAKQMGWSDDLKDYMGSLNTTDYENIKENYLLPDMFRRSTAKSVAPVAEYNPQTKEERYFTPEAGKGTDPGFLTSAFLPKAGAGGKMGWVMDPKTGQPTYEALSEGMTGMPLSLYETAQNQGANRADREAQERIANAMRQATIGIAQQGKDIAAAGLQERESADAARQQEEATRLQMENLAQGFRERQAGIENQYKAAEQQRQTNKYRLAAKGAALSQAKQQLAPGGGWLNKLVGKAPSGAQINRRARSNMYDMGLDPDTAAPLQIPRGAQKVTDMRAKATGGGDPDKPLYRLPNGSYWQP